MRTSGLDPDNDTARGLSAMGLSLLLLSVGPSILRTAESPLLTFAAWRMVAGAVGYYAFLRMRGQRLNLAELRNGALGGATFGVSIAFGYAAIANTSIANALIIGALRPAVLLAFVGPLLGERVRFWSVVWTALAISGVSIMVVGSGESSGSAFFGDALAVAGMLAGTAFFLVTKKARSDHDALTYSTAMTIVAAFVLLPAAAVSDGSLMPMPAGSDWLRILLMTLLPGVGHVLVNYSIGKVNLTVVANATLLLPIMSTVFAWLTVEEPVVALQVVGMLVTVVALIPLVRDEQRGSDAVPNR